MVVSSTKGIITPHLKHIPRVWRDTLVLVTNLLSATVPDKKNNSTDRKSVAQCKKPACHALNFPCFECSLSLSCIDVAQKVRHYAAIIKIATPRGHRALFAETSKVRWVTPTDSKLCLLLIRRIELGNYKFTQPLTTQ